MHQENIYLRNRETNHPKNEPVVLSGASTDQTGPAHTGKEFPDGAKPHAFFRPAFVITGMALCMGLTSCVVPFDSPGGGSVSVTSYSPGHRVNSLPGGYRSEIISGGTYYYHDGYYYRQGSGGYMVVDAPRNSRYYDDYSRRQRTYQPDRVYRQSDNRYGQRYDRGEVITRLPDGYRTVNHRGNTYYRVGDRYYLRQNDSYVITTSPY
jgi:hypothetical protein